MVGVQFIGGPYDGTELSTGLGAAFLFTDGKRCFRSPAAGRALYRQVGATRTQTMNVRIFQFAGLTHVLCKCGAFRHRRRSCGLCGAEESHAA